MVNLPGSSWTDREEILVVDDDPAICALLEQTLEEQGYHPFICMHPDCALKLSKGGRFRLAFVDINLPDMNGLTLASRLKEEDPRREVVFISGHGSFDNAVQAIKVGAYDYLRKPFNISEFTMCLHRFEERDALKQRIRWAEGRYARLVQSIPLLIFVMRDDLQIEFVNQACYPILGYRPEEAMKEQGWFLARIHRDDREKVRKLFEAAFRPGGEPVSVECRLLHRETHVIHSIISSISRPEEIEIGRPRRIEGIIVDITDRVVLEKALVQSEKLKTLGIISAEVAHEIRNPLMSIGGFARRMQKQIPNSREVAIIVRESKRLERLLDRIKNYLKPVEVRRRPCGVNSILEECLELLKPEIQQREIECEVHMDHGLPEVYLDPDILEHIFINLTRNIMGLNSSGEKFMVRTYQSSHTIHVDFRNGLKRPVIKDPELFFLPFNEGGQSFDLALSYRLIKNIGGFLTFNQSRDHLTFTVSLPKAGRPDGEKTVQPPRYAD